ncbi:MAG: 16S rRNA (uracil(1498)-N(3))-methyltransferase [Pseudomonadota bacterium]
MAQDAGKIRLHVAADATAGGDGGPSAASLEPVAGSWVAGHRLTLGRDQAHYLLRVMRLGHGARLSVFNGRDGEWAAEIAEASKRDAMLALIERLRPPEAPPDLWLCFAPIKKARTDFIVEKAVELGCRRIVPCLTQHTNAERVRTDRLAAHAVEAAEQCGLVHVPEVAEPVSLKALLDSWPEGRRLMVCDERAAGFGRETPADLPPAADALSSARLGDAGWAVFCGPEGGFSDSEITRLAAMPDALAVGLGPRVLRADTAAVAAITLWQSVLGDWR